MLSLGLGVTSSLTSVEALVRGLYSAGGVLPRVVLDFDDNNYVLNSGPASFNKAFMGNSPKLTYSTSSNSTMVNSAGNIVWAPHNLVDSSEDFSNAAWIKNNVSFTTNVTAPDGTNTAWEFSPPSGLTDPGSSAYTVRFYDGIDSKAGQKLTFSVFVKPVVTKSLYVGDPDAADLERDVYIQLQADQSSGQSSWNADTASWELVDADHDAFSLDIGGGWYHIGITYTVASNDTGNNHFIQMSNRTAPQFDPYPSGSEMVYIWGAHVYRSDLGGMAQVPGAATGFETYVPTNGNAEYLPRVGHHVYNGSAWVNEGLLIESEARTNLVPQSDLNDAAWGVTRATKGSNAAVSPDGTANAIAIIANTDNNSHFVSDTLTVTAATPYTVSVYAKAGGQDWVTIYNDLSNTYFDLSSGVVGTVASNHNTTASIQDVGNGWYRCSITFTPPDTSYLYAIGPAIADNSNSYVGDNTTEDIYLWGAQLEAAPTPSSYMPTSGGTYTRTAQSLEVPPAEFGWPEPEYIGPNLVDNSEFTSDLNLWTEKGTSGVVTWDASGAALIGDGDGATNTKFTQIVDTVVGAVYELSVDVSGTGTGVLIGVDSNYGSSSYNDSGTVVYRWVANSVSEEVTIFRFRNHVGQTLIDNISVREINPLSVSLQMDGRMDYVDGGTTQDSMLLGWSVNAQNRIYWAVNGSNALNGALQLFQVNNNTYDNPGSVADYFAAGFNVPFNIASRHGSTFINSAADGVLGNINTTPTALTDLSGANIQIAYDFMGTISQFRQFAGDIGDGGIVEATNPSTEPTLSLSFDGTEGSFYNFNWSE